MMDVPPSTGHANSIIELPFQDFVVIRITNRRMPFL